MKRVCGLFICFFLSAACHAAAQSDEIEIIDYEPFYYSPELPDVLMLIGPVTPRAGFAFRRALNAHPEVDALFLDSPGGSVPVSLTIAEEVKERSFITVVPEDAICFSSCSFIFFAGDIRFIDGKLGVHQIWGSDDEETMQLQLSDVVEALNRYDVHPGVLPLMLRTPPDDMYVFSQAEIAELGLENVEPAVAERAPEPPAPPKATPQHARAFVERIIKAHESARDQALMTLREAYDLEVHYFGELKSRDAVLLDKASYFDRWEHRQYWVLDDGLSVDCEARHCTVTGYYRWNVFSHSRRRGASGTASFGFRVTNEFPLRVIGETSEVIERDEL